ncbi:MAG: hypothetical protein AB1403_20185, partial [Candidatus Riflebacteria bacterium]
MNMLDQAHPFILREWGMNVLEIIIIDDEDDASQKTLGAMFLLSKRFNNMILALPPRYNLSPDSEPQLRDLAQKINLKLVLLSSEQIPFSL